LDAVRSIKTYYYTWNSEAEPGMALKEGRQIGVLAQDVEKIFPELVSENRYGFKSVDYARLSAITLAAIGEQQSMIESQQSQIQRLSDEVETLKLLLNNLLSAK
jgi:hypothetical protein